MALRWRGKEEAKWRPISKANGGQYLSLSALSHTIVCLFTGGFSLSVSTQQIGRIHLFLFTSYFLFYIFFISFFLCISCSSFFLLSLPFICLSFFLSFHCFFVVNIFFFSINVYFLPCTHVMFFSCEIVFNFFPILI
jgi:hypothetical protein